MRLAFTPSGSIISRHFAASVLLAGGVDVRTTAGRLGHAQPAVTLKTYAHVMEAADREAAKILGQSIALLIANQIHSRSGTGL